MQSADRTKEKLQQKSNQIKKKTQMSIPAIMEHISFLVTFFATTYFIVILPDIVKFNLMTNQTDNPFDYRELFYILIGFIGSIVTLKLIKYFFSDFLKRTMIEQKFRKETEEQRIDRLCNYIHASLYYTVVVLVAYYILKDSDLLPRFCGGKLRLKEFVNFWPKDVHPYHRAYLLLGFGHHFERMVSLLLHKRHTADFFVMNLHHFITFFLIVTCYFMRQLHYGIPVLFLHDIVDSPLHVAKLFRELKPMRKYMMPVFIFMYIVWIITRVIVFTSEVLNNLKIVIMKPSPIIGEYYFVSLFQILQLHVLGVLDYYWIIMISKAMYDKIFKNKEKVGFEGEKEKLN